jgi:hypothetical protein
VGGACTAAARARSEGDPRQSGEALCALLVGGVAVFQLYFFLLLVCLIAV